MDPSQAEQLHRASRMSPLVFGAAVYALVFFSFLMFAVPTREPLANLLAALALGGAASMMWHRWIRRGSQWLVRGWLALGFAALVVLVAGWLPREDVFVVCRPGCPPRPGTIGPLAIMWVAGLVAFVGALWGKGFDLAQLRRSR